ncbi:MAG: amidohydrolase family protein, partial [Caldilineaceae bacterium]|nr:amidohydrolase family protein [Caldilineaceae bacterium]
AGFTTVRNLGLFVKTGGYLLDVALAKAIDLGWVDGPRVVPAGHAIAPTGGHLDPTMFQAFAPNVLPLTVEEGLANGVDEVRKAVRYQVKYGARVIKVCASNGVMSHTGPAGAQQYSDDELAAIVDEAHWIKNGQTKRATGTATAVGRAGFRVMLTGTPMDNHVGELWHPLSVLTGRWTWGSPLDFRKRYAGAASNGFGYEDRGPRHIEELRRRMEPWYLRRTAADLPAGSLPPLQRVRISSPLGAAARRAHDALLSGHDLETLLTAVLEGRAGEDTLALLGRLRAVCSDAKVNATRDYVANLIGQGQSVVVFSWRRKTAQDFVGGFLDDVRSPTVTCPDFAAAIHGAHNQAQRDAVVREFRYAAGRGSALLSATFGVLKEGVTLTPARHVVLHDLDWLFSPLLQAEKRVHRLTQGGGCVSAWSVAEDSFDQVLARLLLRKADWLDRTLGIKAPRESVEELELSGLIPNDTAMADWARAQLKRWV